MSNAHYNLRASTNTRAHPTKQFGLMKRTQVQISADAAEKRVQKQLAAEKQKADKEAEAARLGERTEDYTRMLLRMIVPQKDERSWAHVLGHEKALYALADVAVKAGGAELSDEAILKILDDLEGQRHEGTVDDEGEGEMPGLADVDEPEEVDNEGEVMGDDGNVAFDDAADDVKGKGKGKEVEGDAGMEVDEGKKSKPKVR